MNRFTASLGMYDHPAQRAANDRLWGEIARRVRARGIAAPYALDHTRPVEAMWRDPTLLFGQICGYPLVSEPDLALRVIGVPVYEAPGCADGHHVSYIIGRDRDRLSKLADYRGRRVAINAYGSNTGHNLLRAAIAPLAEGGRFFGGVVVTGSHRASAAAVRDGVADIAAIDAVTHAALSRFEPAALDGLRIIGTTAASPTLPFVTARETGIETVVALRVALAGVMADPGFADARDALFLRDIIPGGVERYAAVRALELQAIAAGYPVLA